jgi:D-serine dehydratase
MQTQSIASYHKGLGIGDNYHEWNLLREDIGLPAAVISSENMEHNLCWMQKFIEKYNVKLAPHGKTSMSVKLFHKFLDHGAWGITLATVHQVQIAYSAGIRRILMANQLIGKTNMTIIQQLLDDDPNFDFYCVIDSSTNVEQLGKFFNNNNNNNKQRRLQVLLEIGVNNGRTGVRNEEEEKILLDTLSKYQNSLALVGVELFEGVLTEEQPVRFMLRRAVACLQRLINSNQLSRTPPILSGAGSLWYDIVAEEFSKLGPTVDIILRSGCYVTHDMGIYRRGQTHILQRNSIARDISHDGGALRAALQVWAYVQSIPETNLAVIGFGKRDAAFDAGYPIPSLHYRSEWSKPIEIDNNKYKITNMYDQHAILTCPSDHNLIVGDIIAFDISHPCLTMDRWKKILLINNDYTVIDILDTYF